MAYLLQSEFLLVLDCQNVAGLSQKFLEFCES